MTGIHKAAISLCATMMAVTALAAGDSAKTDSGPQAVIGTAQLSGTATITPDLDTAVAFYTRFLGFREHKRVVLDNDATRQVFGLNTGETVTYVSLIPAAFPEQIPSYTGLSFAQIGDAKSAAYGNDPERRPYFGETVMAYSVKNLDAIAAAMSDAGVPIVAPLALSGTRKSKALTALDPNGVRVQMYEILPAKTD